MESEHGDLPEFGEQELETGRKLFAGHCEFVRGVADLKDLPPADRLEVAFAGRSNVGKSSLLNALTGRNNLARTSNTPGRTQELNFFALGESFYLVDLPGYGYARVGRARVKAWTELIKRYLAGRATLKRLFLLIDARHGLKSSDREMMTLMDDAAVSYQVVLTKCDKPKRVELEHIISAVVEELGRHGAAHPQLHATSSRDGTGLEHLRAEIARLAVG